MIVRRVLLCVVLLAAASAVRCGNSTSTTPSGTPTRIISITGSLAFGNVPVGGASTLTIGIANSGNSTLTISGVAAIGSTGSAGLSINPGSGTVAPGGTLSISVQFAPAAIQSYSTVITVAGDQTSGTNTINFSGSGVVPTGPLTSFGDGQRLVNTVIAPGIYYSVPPTGCYFERDSGTDGTPNEIIANNQLGSGLGQWIVEIKSTDVAFTSLGCGTWNQTPRSGLKSTITPGMWQIGSQIQAGTWTTNSVSSCAWERLSDTSAEPSAILANNFASSAGLQTVTILPSDAAFDATVQCGTWVRSSSAATEEIAGQTMTFAEIAANRDLARAQWPRRPHR